MPWWDRVRAMSHVRFALMGVNAVVVGLLASAFYSPLWVNAIHSVTDFALAVIALLLLAKVHLPPWLIVGVAATAGYFLL